MILGSAAVLLFAIFLMGTINQAKEVTFNEILLLLKGGADLNQDGVMDVIGKLEVDAYNWTAHIMEGKKIVQSYTTVAPSIYDYNSLYTLLVNLGVANGTSGAMGTIPFEITFVDPNEGSMLASFIHKK